jgi:hypothetical protein
MPENFSAWSMKCAKENCELINIEYIVESDSAECGGCNTIYSKPE